VERELSSRLQIAESDRQCLADQLSAAQRQIASLQLEKQDMESQHDRDKTSLMKTIDKVVRPTLFTYLLSVARCCQICDFPSLV